MSSTTQDTDCPLSDCRKAKRNVAAYKKLVADNKEKHDAEIKKLEEEKALASRITARRIDDSRQALFGTYGQDFEGRGELQKQLTAAQNIASACRRDHGDFNPEAAAELADAKVKLGEQAAEIEKLKQERAEKVKKLNRANGDLIQLQREHFALEKKRIDDVKGVEESHREALQRGDAQWRIAVGELEKAREQSYPKFIKYTNRISEEKRLREQDVKREREARKSEVAALEEQLEDAHRKEVADLRYEIRSTRGNAVEVLKIEREARRKEVVELKTKLEDAHKEEVAALEAELKDARDKEVATIKSEKDAYEKEILKAKAEVEDAHKKEVAELKADLEKMKIELEASKELECNARKELEDVSKAAAAAKLSPPTIIADTQTKPVNPITPILIQRKTATLPKIVLTPSAGAGNEVPSGSTIQDDKVKVLQDKVAKLAASVKFYQKEHRVRWGKQKAYVHGIYTGQATQPLIYGKGEWDGSSLSRVGKMEYLRMQVLGVTSDKVKNMIDASLPSPPTGIRKRGGSRKKERELFEIELSDGEDNAPIGIDFFKQRRAMQEKNAASTHDRVDKQLMEEQCANMKRWDREMMRSFSISDPTFFQQSGINTTQSAAHPNTASSTLTVSVSAATTTTQTTVPTTTITPAALATPSPAPWSLGSLLSWMASY
ncbi:hypothetical protein DL95DRAFT_417238 [Leptodontidium sp. 2 PMI_412]|nr:hypothetical protein DL95DRAFT_417238 [Leptodontidium sp. 2 PMI_412]